MNAQSWSPRDERPHGHWAHPSPPQDLPPLRLTPLGRTALRITAAALCLLATAVGFLIRTPADHAITRCTSAFQPCPIEPALHTPDERTP